jgi:hypothetical protein
MTVFLLNMGVNAAMYFIASKNTGTVDIKTEVNSRLVNASYLILLLAFFYTLILNLLLDTYLIGTYTDIIIGLLMWGCLDFTFITLGNEEKLRAAYIAFRKFYIWLNFTRILIYFFFLFMLRMAIPITYPPENINRTKDLVVFNRYHFNGTDGSYYSPEFIYPQVNVFKRVGLIFKKKILVIPKSESDVGQSAVYILSPDSVLIDRLNMFLYRKDGAYYLKEDVYSSDKEVLQLLGEPIKLD